MSDWYEAVAVRDVQPSESASLADSVISRLASDGIIQSDIDPESVLGGDGGYRPGPNIESLYKLTGEEGPFWSLLTNGVEVCAGRWVNQLGFTCFDGFTCPRVPLTIRSITMRWLIPSRGLLVRFSMAAMIWLSCVHHAIRQILLPTGKLILTSGSPTLRFNSGIGPRWTVIHGT